MRKSVVTGFANKIMNKLGDNRVIAGRNTIESVIADLSKDYTSPTGGMIKDATGFLVASEFANLLQDNDAAMTILTDLYDAGYHDETGWRNKTKTGGAEVLKRVNLTMLGASNLAHLEDNLQLKDIKGGFIARTYLIHREKKRTVNSLVSAPTRKISFDKLLKWLQVLRDLRGKFQFDPAAATYYDEWYQEYNKRQELKEEEDETGTSSRFEDHVLKVAMLISLAKDTDLRIRISDLDESLSACFSFLDTVQKLMLSKKGDRKKPRSDIARTILQELVKIKKGEWLERTTILKRGWGQLSSWDLDNMIETLNEGEIIEVLDDPEKGPLYRLVSDRYDKIMGGG